MLRTLYHPFDFVTATWISLSLSLFLLHQGICEGIWGKTLGKALIGHNVVKSGAESLGIGVGLARAVLRAVEGFISAVRAFFFAAVALLLAGVQLH